MIKVFYAFAWTMAAIGFMISILSGTFDTAAAVFFSLVALVLIYAFALWSVTVNTREQPRIYER